MNFLPGRGGQSQKPCIDDPSIMAAAQRMGEYLRYRSALGTRLSELAILVTARQWRQRSAGTV